MANRFDNCPTKEWLQDNLYTYIGNRMKSNVVMAGHPPLERQITNALKIASTPKAEVYLIEKNVARYHKMYDRHYVLITDSINGVTTKWPERWWLRVHPILGDISGYEAGARLDKPVRFEDLDMNQTMSSIRYLVGHRLLRQSSLKSKLRKCMLITSSLSRCELDETLTILNRLLSEILDAKFAVWPIVSGRKYSRKHRDSGVREYTPYIKQHGRLLKDGLRLFSYRDRAPMFTCMILYV